MAQKIEVLSLSHKRKFIQIHAFKKNLNKLHEAFCAAS